MCKDVKNPEIKPSSLFSKNNRVRVILDSDDVITACLRAVVKEYNNKREIFPNNFVSNMFSFEKRSMFELEDVSDRDEIKVDFGS